MTNRDGSPMIEVRVEETGDSAWAETPEAALLAATTICDDAGLARKRRQGDKRTVRFYVDDVMVGRPLNERSLWVRRAA